MKIIKVKDYEELSSIAAELIAKQVKEKPNSVLGLATGSTPIGTYKKLIEAGADFFDVTTFNLDEYCGLSQDHPQSYYHFMKENLFNHVNIKHGSYHFPDEKEVEEYEIKIKHAGGIDLQLLGVGSNGHIGFNEPDKVFHSKTRVVVLADSTIQDNARFFARVDDVPIKAVTMGIKTIMRARKIILVAGSEKEDVIKELENPVVDPQFPVSILHLHPDCTVIYVTAS